MTTRRNPPVLIIGAGATGMLAAIRLREAGPGACQGWYQDADGVPVVCPCTWSTFTRSMEAANINDFPMPQFQKEEVSHAV